MINFYAFPKCNFCHRGLPRAAVRCPWCAHRQQPPVMPRPFVSSLSASADGYSAENGEAGR